MILTDQGNVIEIRFSKGNIKAASPSPDDRWGFAVFYENDEFLDDMIIHKDDLVNWADFAGKVLAGEIPEGTVIKNRNGQGSLKAAEDGYLLKFTGLSGTRICSLTADHTEQLCRLLPKESDRFFDPDYGKIRFYRMPESFSEERHIRYYYRASELEQFLKEQCRPF